MLQAFLFTLADLQSELAKLKHRVQVAEEERDIAVEKERDIKRQV